MVDERLAVAVLDLLRTRGPVAVTMEAVAERAGVAKTTVYRRHANRAELLASVLSRAVGDVKALPDGTVRDKIRGALDQVWSHMVDVLGPGGLAAMMTDADPEFTALFRASLRPYEDALVTRIRDDAAAGLLRPDVDADGVVSLFVGAYLGELVRRGRVADDWRDRALEMMWTVLAAPADDDRRPDR
ncbi:TetR/AcrR family transcriptional regulator [Nocardioides sp. T2.26MG-1]|uniref:TetR/AcrR family transcriptional regulator n=1 Tax=Nocardioides sp. T2.26MG-1 TaxID=3041166 RepID=UPI00254097DD|nr:TetR/AcrR family transcriptional regulator [Nocardioides sp. T2.26MG-1]